MCALSYKVGVFTKSNVALAVGGTPFTQAVTGVGFKPKAVLFFFNQSNTGITDIMRPSIGWATGDTAFENYTIAFGADDNLTTTSNTFRRASNAYCIWGGSGTTVGPQIKVTAMDADGFTLTYDANDTGATNIQYIAIGGTDVVNWKAGTFIINTSATGNQDVTWSNGGNWTASGSPSVVFFMGANCAVPSAGQSISHDLWYFGMAKNSAQQGVIAGMSVDNAAATVANRYQRTDRCIAFGIEGSTPGLLEAEASFVSMLTNGFRINVIDVPITGNTNPVFYLAIQGGTWNIGNLTTPTSGTGIQAYTVTNGTPTPKGLFTMTDCSTPNTTVITNQRYSFGAADNNGSPSNKWSVIGADQDGITLSSTTPSITVRGTSSGTASNVIRTVLEAATGTSSQITSVAALSSFDTSTGFSLNWTTIDAANAREVIYLTAADSPSGSALVKLANESMGITEAINRKVGLLRFPTVNPEGAIGITEATLKFLGKVRVVGNTGFTGTGSAGFTIDGFTDTGFTTTPSTVMDEDYLSADYLAADFVTTAAPVLQPEESVSITESVIKVIGVPTGILTPADLILRYSGGSGYTGSGGATGSIGGGISNTVVANNTLNAVWDDTGTSESSAGDTEFRCLYLRNTHATLTAQSVRMWIETNTPAGDEIQIAVGGSAVNGTETAATDENTLSPATPATTFVTAPDENSAITLGDIPAGQHKAFWIKRIVPASTTAFADDSYTIRVSFVSDFG